ncbi:hypothetical protein P4O66_013299, partial [Electrophorus voltai]
EDPVFSECVIRERVPLPCKTWSLGLHPHAHLSNPLPQKSSQISQRRSMHLPLRIYARGSLQLLSKGSSEALVQKQLVQKQLVQKHSFRSSSFRSTRSEALVQKQLVQKHSFRSSSFRSIRSEAARSEAARSEALVQKQLVQKQLVQKQLIQKQLIQKHSFRSSSFRSTRSEAAHSEALVQKQLVQKQLVQKQLIQKHSFRSSSFRSSSFRSTRSEALVQKQLIQKHSFRSSSFRSSSFRSTRSEAAHSEAAHSEALVQKQLVQKQLVQKHSFRSSSFRSSSFRSTRSEALVQKQLVQKHSFRSSSFRSSSFRSTRSEAARSEALVQKQLVQKHSFRCSSSLKACLSGVIVMTMQSGREAVECEGSRNDSWGFAWTQIIQTCILGHCFDRGLSRRDWGLEFVCGCMMRLETGGGRAVSTLLPQQSEKSAHHISTEQTQLATESVPASALTAKRTQSELRFIDGHEPPAFPTNPTPPRPYNTSICRRPACQWAAAPSRSRRLATSPSANRASEHISGGERNGACSIKGDGNRIRVH